MKKTLIALLACSGLAVATDLSDYTTLISDPSQGFTIDSTTFSVAITLDVATLQSYVGLNQSAVKHELVCYAVTNSVMTGVTTNYSSASGKIANSGLYYRWGGNYAWGHITAESNVITAPEGVTNLTQIDWDSVAGAGLVYTFSPSASKGTQAALTLLDSNGEVIYSAYNRSTNLTTASAQLGTLTFADAATTVYYFNSELSADEVKLVAAQAANPVPEPATGTLSLLALAGLCARRRRK